MVTDLTGLTPNPNHSFDYITDESQAKADVMPEPIPRTLNPKPVLLNPKRSRTDGYGSGNTSNEKA